MATAFRKEMSTIWHKAQRAAIGVDRRRFGATSRERVLGQQLILGAGWLIVQSSLYIFLNIFTEAAADPIPACESPKMHPVGMGTVNEVVEAVLSLESAGFVTGETLHIDGGAHAGKW